MKRRKILLSLLLMAAVICTMSACGNNNSSEKETESTTAQQTTEAQETESEIVGCMVSHDGHSLLIKDHEGQEYDFDTTGAQFVIENGMHEGNWVYITYTGQLNGTDTEGCKVVKVVDNDKNIKKVQKKIKIKATEETLYTTSGVHVRASYNTSSKILGTLAKGSKVERTGVCDNDWSRIVYKGQDAYVYGDYLTADKPKENAKPAKTTGKKPDTHQNEKTNKPSHPQKVEPKKDEKETVKGVIVDATMDTLTLGVTVDGAEKQYLLYTGQAKITTTNGLIIGNKITVVYTGNLDKNPVVISIVDKAANKAAAPKSETEAATQGETAESQVTLDESAESE